MLLRAAKRRHVAQIVCCVAVGGSTAACSPPAQRIRTLDDLRAAPLYTFNERELDAYLHSLANDMPDPRDRLVHVARQSIGQPYRLFPLGEFPYELHDADPLYRLSAGDCVTFVEQSFAMALSDDWASFFRTLQRIRYRDGEIGIRTRNHFTEGDWNPNNAWLFDDVTPSLASADIQRVRVRIDRRAFFSKFGLDIERPVEGVTLTYVSREDWPRIAGEPMPGDVVEFVRGDGDAKYVSHMGIILRDEDGRPTLIHATEPAVCEEPLADYVDRCGWIAGMVFLRMKEPAAPRESSQIAAGRR